MIIGCTLSLCGVFFSALAKDIYVMSITYGALLGAGAGMMYCYPLKCAMDWNPEKKGVISGALLSGLGFGAFA